MIRLPRARGDRPSHQWTAPGTARASPCPRGSTPSGRTRRARDRGFPVPAGIDPIGERPAHARRWLPRARGDRPAMAVDWTPAPRASPCPRGSTLQIAIGVIADLGFTVPAGIDPWAGRKADGMLRLPRARGDRPQPKLCASSLMPASPCPRGSTVTGAAQGATPEGFPVPAGIDPIGGCTRRSPPRLPRARGDRPVSSLRSAGLLEASPCPRGSTCFSRLQQGVLPGFPVPAGIDPTSFLPVSKTLRLPRARGDRPFSRRV